MKLLLKIVVSVLVIFVLVAGGGMFYISRGLEAGSKVEINDVSLSDIKDGVYNGGFKAGRWTNEVAVKVKDHKITDIQVTKDVMFPMPEATKDLISKVVDKQSTKVDIVSGSTVTSKAYLKSIENALSKGSR